MVKSSKRMLEVIVILIAIISSTPLLERAVLLALASFLIIVYLKMSAGSNVISKNFSFVPSSILYIVLIFIYTLLGFSDTSPVSYTVSIIFFLSILLTPFIPVMDTVKRMKKVWKLMVLIGLLNVVYNIYLCIRYPEINWQGARELFSEEMLAGMNIGGTRFYSFLLFFFDVCFFVYLNCKQKGMKYFSLLCSIITAIYICVFCLKATVVVFFLLSIVLLIYSRRRVKMTRFMTILAVTGVLMIVIITNFEEEIIKFIVSVSPSDRLSVRLVTLIDSDSDAASSVTLTNRTDLYMLSVKTWLSSPFSFLFGIGDHGSAANVALSGIGHHSDFLDTLGRYGILGFMLIASAILKGFKLVIQQFEMRYKLQIFSIFFIFILCGFTKAVFLPGVGFVLFILLPLSKYVIEGNR